MEILRKSGDYNIVINQENDFQTNLGWEEGMDIFEDEVLTTIINPIDNYETVRYIHEPYDTDLNGVTVNQCDIWFKFYFIDTNTSYNYGLDYSLVGIAPKDNAKMIKTTTESYFKLEFFKTPNNEPPSRMNRKLVFSKNLQLPIGEKFYYNTLRQNIHVPVFMGSNYRNKENMYLFWFQDDTVLSDSTLSGDTFYMTAKFLNASDGSIVDFTNSKLLTTTQISESADLYYKVIINKNGYTYRVYNYDGSQNERVGNGLTNSINFYEKGGEIILPTPQPTLSPTPQPTLSPTPQPTLSPTPPSTPAPPETYAISVSPNSADDGGGAFTATVTATNVSFPKTLYITILSTTGNVNLADFQSNFPSQTSGITLNNSGQTYSFSLAEDFLTEGTEKFKLQLKSGSTSGTTLSTSNEVTINDTSLDRYYYTLVPCAGGANLYSTPYEQGIFTSGNRVEGSSGVYYVIGNSSTSDLNPGGNKISVTRVEGQNGCPDDDTPPPPPPLVMNDLTTDCTTPGTYYGKVFASWSGGTPPYQIRAGFAGSGFSDWISVDNNVNKTITEPSSPYSNTTGIRNTLGGSDTFAVQVKDSTDDTKGKAISISCSY